MNIDNRIGAEPQPTPASRFLVLDVETANINRASICQIGIATFEDGRLVEQWGKLLNPEDDFDEFNVRAIHGITPEMVADAPTYPAVAESIARRLRGQIVVTHMPFDRTALAQVADKYDVPLIECTWLDSARVAQRAWPDRFAQSGYGLQEVCKFLQIAFKHHDAAEDARAAGEITLRAMEATGLDLRGWLQRVEQRIDLNAVHARCSKPRTKFEANVDGPLFGQEVVITGTLEHFCNKDEARRRAAELGCQVPPDLRQTTTILVLGKQDPRKLKGHEKSAKHRTAESLYAKGQNITCLPESDFLRMLQGYEKTGT